MKAVYPLSSLLFVSLFLIHTTSAMVVDACTLHAYVRCGNEELVRQLIAQGADVNFSLSFGTSLHVAVLTNQIGMCALLLESKANPNARDIHGVTPFHLACARNCPEIFSLLEKAGADFYAKDNGANTPLIYAVRAGEHAVCTQLLAKKGLKSFFKNKLNFKSFINSVNCDGNTALNLAAISGHIETCVVLITNNANVTTPNNYGYSPLHTAAEYGHTDIAELLIKHGSPVDIQRIDLYRYNHFDTPFLLALQKNRVDTALFLLLNGANFNVSGKHRFSAVHYAAQQGSIPLLRALRARGAAVDVEDEAQCVPLKYAVEAGKVQAVRYLIAAGTNIQKQNSHRVTPLHTALVCKEGDPDLILPFLTVPQAMPPVMLTVLLINKFHKDSFLGRVPKDVVREHIVPHLFADCANWQLNNIRNLLLQRSKNPCIIGSSEISNLKMVAQSLRHSDRIVTMFDPDSYKQHREAIVEAMYGYLKSNHKKK